MATQDDAQQAIFDQISQVAGEIGGFNASGKARILADLALAYRLAAGGPQPGGLPTKG